MPILNKLVLPLATTFLAMSNASAVLAKSDVSVPLPTRATWDGAYLSSLSSFSVFRDENGCVRAHTRYGYAPLVIWQDTVSWNNEEAGLINLNGGKQILRFNETVAATGPLRLSRDIKGDLLTGNVPDCVGPYIFPDLTSKMVDFMEGTPNGDTAREKLKLHNNEHIAQLVRTLIKEQKGQFIDSLHVWPETHYLLSFKDVAAGEALLDSYLQDQPDLRELVKIEQASEKAIAYDANADELSKAFYDAGLTVGMYFSRWDSNVADSEVFMIEAGNDIGELNQLLAEGVITLPEYVQISGASYQDDAYSYNHEASLAYKRKLRTHTDHNRIAAVARKVFEGLSRPDERASDAAVFLLQVGMSADRAETLNAIGFNPADAQENQGGSNWFTKVATVAENTVEATMVSVDASADLGDGFYSTLTFSIDDVLSGKHSVGDTVEMRHKSGFGSDGKYVQHDSVIVLLENLPGAVKPGHRFLLTYSDDFYQFQTAVSNGVSAGNYVSAYREPMRISDDDMVSMSSGNTQPLHNVKTLLKPLKNVTN